MSRRKQDQTIQRLLSKTNFKPQLQWLLRSLAIITKPNLADAGFVLPTTTLLLLVVTLVTTAVLTRSFSRTTQVIGDYQAKEISNAASPAIDRAKAKIEYLFKKDSRLPSGVPAQRVLISMMRNKGENGVPQLRDASGKTDKPYTLPDEKRIDIRNGQTYDNAWYYEVDLNGDGKIDDENDGIVAYSIVMQAPTTLTNQGDKDVKGRAWKQEVRNGPLSATQNSNTTCPQSGQNGQQGSNASEEGWFNVTSATLRKNFQVNAVVIPMNREKQIAAALEFQQDRQLDRGNKWGAWFRNDIELTRPPTFNWNGAIHTEGSIFVGGNDNFTAYLLSSPNSCIFSRTASEITFAENTNIQNQIEFQGQLVSGALEDNAQASNTNRFHFLDQSNQPIVTLSNIATHITRDRDSVINSITPSDIALNPIKIFTEDKSEANGVTNWTTLRDSNWQNRELVSNRRTYNQQARKPYVDDLYRADNRYGPKPNFLPAGTQIGAPITNADPNYNRLVSNTPSGTEENVGLDGYWERRARLEGLRIIVGQRLELSNPLDPASGVNHEARQRRTLRDNLAAVQAAAIYHQANRDAVTGNIRNIPVACLAATAHPGTATTITRSRTFNSITIGGLPNTNFFTGGGTNGYEFTVHPESAYTSSSTLMRALRNLGRFAGDYEDTNNDGIPERSGAFPPTQEASPSTTVHPHPEMTKWGNFSELRRAVSLIDSGTTYQNLSPADQSTLNTAACMIGMLAYNIDFINVNASTDPSLATLRTNIDASRASSVGTSYPILYYLFPTENHGEDSSIPSIRAKLDPRRRTGTDGAYITTSNTGYTYTAFTNTEITNIALQPRPIPNWALPKATSTFSLRTNTISVGGTAYRVPFIDSGIFNGREMMSVRVLDIDLDLLRRNTLPIDPADPDDSWLPQKAIVYAFREDAVREDAIARPATETWNNCDTLAKILTSRCRVNASTPQDLPVNSANGISIKPVDFYADPDRRPYGFRLNNGADLTRTSLALGDVQNLRGLSFISDNPVYVQGNLNLHSTNGTTNNLEEFTESLRTDYANFYTRSTRESRFADPSQDRWRPTEIIADAVTILSSNFCDGSIADSFTTAGTSSGATVPLAQYNCGTNNGVTSYLTQNRPSTAVSDWRREITGDSNSPIVVDSNGTPQRTGGSYSGSYYSFAATKPMIDASATRVNAIIVSGLVPSRANQFNGGLHNFPRFVEDWTGIPLYISGALLQLNFSTHATAPFDHDAWEPGATPTTTSVRPYYVPPNRLWGYDVALQIAPAGPVSRRFVTPNNTRSEFYQELSKDDNYIQTLRCGYRTDKPNIRIDPNPKIETECSQL